MGSRFITVVLEFDKGASRPFTYICPFEDVEVGDPVIVPFGRSNEIRLAWVYELDPPQSVKKLAVKWVAGHADMRAHHMRTAMGVPPLTEGE